MSLLIPDCAGTGRHAAHPDKRYMGVGRRGHKFIVAIYTNPWHCRLQLTYLGTFDTSLEAVWPGMWATCGDSCTTQVGS